MQLVFLFSTVLAQVFATCGTAWWHADCPTGRFCNFDKGTYGECESCKYISDCIRVGFLTREGFEACCACPEKAGTPTCKKWAKEACSPLGDEFYSYECVIPGSSLCGRDDPCNERRGRGDWGFWMNWGLFYGKELDDGNDDMYYV